VELNKNNYVQEEAEDVTDNVVDNTVVVIDPFFEESNPPTMSIFTLPVTEPPSPRRTETRNNDRLVNPEWWSLPPTEMVIAAKTRRPTPNPSFRPQSSGGWRDGMFLEEIDTMQPWMLDIVYKDTFPSVTPL
jgi:hypothetical protein